MRGPDAEKSSPRAGPLFYLNPYNQRHGCAEKDSATRIPPRRADGRAEEKRKARQAAKRRSRTRGQPPVMPLSRPIQRQRELTPLRTKQQSGTPSRARKRSRSCPSSRGLQASDTTSDRLRTTSNESPLHRFARLCHLDWPPPTLSPRRTALPPSFLASSRCHRLPIRDSLTAPPRPCRARDQSRFLASRGSRR